MCVCVGLCVTVCVECVHCKAYFVCVRVCVCKSYSASVFYVCAL